MNIKLTEQDFIDCDINEQDCITLKKILVYSQQSAFPEQNVYRLIFVKEIPIELSTDIEQNLFFQQVFQLQQRKYFIKFIALIAEGKTKVL